MGIVGYSIKGKALLGKEFTYKGKQIMVVGLDPAVGTIQISRVVRGKPEDKKFAVKTKDFSRMIRQKIESGETIASLEEASKPCSCIKYPSGCDNDCPRHVGLIPFLGKSSKDGKSAGEISTGVPDSAPASTAESYLSPAANLILESMKMYELAEAKEDFGMVALRLAKRFFRPGVDYTIAKKNTRGSYISTFPVGANFGIERKVLPSRGEIPGNFLQNQVNISLPKQRNQAAIKVVDLLKDVSSGSVLVNNSKKDTAEFKKWAKILLEMSV